jgi:hypothetical protein
MILELINKTDENTVETLNGVAHFKLIDNLTCIEITMISGDVYYYQRNEWEISYGWLV